MSKRDLLEKKLKENKELTDKDLEDIILEYAPIVRFVAQKIALRLPSNIELDDLISSGIIGLMDAVKKYDPERKNKFKTYAEFRIRGAILDELRSKDWVPRSLRDKAKHLDKTVSDLEMEKGRYVTDQEIADYMNLSLDQYYELVNAVRPISILSIDEPSTYSNVDKKSLMSILEVCKMSNPHLSLDMTALQRILTRVLNELPERQRLVLVLYYYEELRLKEIGQVLRVTESRVSQLHAQAIQKLRVRLKSFFKQEEVLEKRSV